MQIGQEPLKSAPRAVPDHFCQLQEAPRVLQEALKRLSTGLCAHEVLQDCIFHRSGPPKGAPGTSKIIKILRTVCKNQGFAILSSHRLLNSIWEPFGLPLAGLLPLKIAETCLETPLGAAKSRSRAHFFDPGALQDRSKRHLRALQEASTRLRHPKRPPGSNFGPI